jgi:acetyl-CoA synthetase
MELLYKKYAKESFDENGLFNGIEFFPTPNFNFGFDVVDELGKTKPEKTAMMWVSNDGEEKKFTFSDMMKKSAQAANYFTSLGIGKGDKVMLILKRHYQFWYAVVALHKIGAIVIPATNLLTKKDIVYRVNVSGTKAIICTSDGDISNYVEEAVPECPTLTIRAMVKGAKAGWQDFDKGVETASDAFDRPTGEAGVTNSDIMLMYFTSGTTGYPKMAAHSFTYPLGHIVTAKYWHNVDPDGLHFTVSDSGWAKSVWGKIYGQWLCEAAIFTYDFEKFVADDILKKIDKYKVTTFCAPPTMYRFFIKEDLANYNLKGLKYATIAGEALNPEVFSQFYNHTGLKLMEGFGQTETTVLVANIVGMTPKPGSMGKPNPQYAVDIVDDKGNTVKAGEVGEIVLRTNMKKPCGMFMGYYLDDERTTAAWHDDLYHTGDVAWVDEDGYIWYVGRTDDLIKSSGYRIGPFEIESVLMEHPAVLECAVTGVPDELRGQAVKATIVLAKGYTASEDLKAEIQNHVKNLTAPYKYPRVVEFVTELPKTISGKIRRVEIREKN